MTSRCWGRCLKVTLQTCAPKNFRSRLWGAERRVLRAQTQERGVTTPIVCDMTKLNLAIGMFVTDIKCLLLILTFTNSSIRFNFRFLDLLHHHILCMSLFSLCCLCFVHSTWHVTWYGVSHVTWLLDWQNWFGCPLHYLCLVVDNSWFRIWERKCWF